jgi:hypothetical protein
VPGICVEAHRGQPLGVALAGNGPCPQITSGAGARAQHDRGQFAARPVEVRLDDLQHEARRAAASNALPPRSSTAMPVCVASQCVVATAPNVPRISGRW